MLRRSGSIPSVLIQFSSYWTVEKYYSEICRFNLVWKFRAATSYWYCYSGSCLCEFFSITFFKDYHQLNTNSDNTGVWSKWKQQYQLYKVRLNIHISTLTKTIYIYITKTDLSTTAMTKPTTKTTSSNNGNTNLSSMQVCCFIISSTNMWMKQLPSISLFSKYMYRYLQNYYMYLYICMYMHGHFCENDM